MSKSESRTILVSACLLGLKTRYDGESRQSSVVSNFIKDGHWTPVPVCPEQLGGLSTPRPAAEFKDGDGLSLLEGKGSLRTQSGTDISAAFLRGAEQTAAIAELSHCSVALLKEKSPSCGTHRIYCNGELVRGSGVTAAYLLKRGIKLLSEEDLHSGQLPEDRV